MFQIFDGVLNDDEVLLTFIRSLISHHENQLKIIVASTSTVDLAERMTDEMVVELTHIDKKDALTLFRKLARRNLNLGTASVFLVRSTLFDYS